MTIHRSDDERAGVERLVILTIDAGYYDYRIDQVVRVPAELDLAATYAAFLRLEKHGKWSSYVKKLPGVEPVEWEEFNT